jgi:GxxExxY protein
MINSETTGKIIRACLEVHNELGPGFQEVVYQRTLALELDKLRLDTVREEHIPVYYKDKKIDKRRVDFVVNEVMVEIKAKKEFDKQDFVQTLSYLKASGFKVGLLINFGARSLVWKRLVN